MSVSTDQSFDSNKPDLEKMILEHISERLSDMKPGDVTDCEGLFNPWVWDVTPVSEHRYIYGYAVPRLVAQGKVPLERAGINGKRHNLYRKI